MKSNTRLMFGMSLALVSGAASAANGIYQDSLHNVTVHAHVWPYATADRPLGDCTPPSDLPVCTDLHRQIRREFSSSDIGMLFGAATSYPQYLTSYSRVLNHYQRFLQEIDANSNPAVAMASK